MNDHLKVHPWPQPAHMINLSGAEPETLEWTARQRAADGPLALWLEVDESCGNEWRVKTWVAPDDWTTQDILAEFGDEVYLARWGDAYYVRPGCEEKFLFRCIQQGIVAWGPPVWELCEKKLGDH